MASAQAHLLSAQPAPVATGLSGDQDEPGGPYTCLELTLVPTGPPDPSEAWLAPPKTLVL